MSEWEAAVMLQQIMLFKLHTYSQIYKVIMNDLYTNSFQKSKLCTMKFLEHKQDSSQLAGNCFI
jgi:hypothetical protein